MANIISMYNSTLFYGFWQHSNRQGQSLILLWILQDGRWCRETIRDHQ